MEETITLSGPVAVTVILPRENADNFVEEFDVYTLLDQIMLGEEDHGTASIERLHLLRETVATRFGLTADQVALNQVLDLRDAVVTMTNRLDEERKKKFSSTASSPASTQDFPLLTSTGQSETSNSGSPTPSPQPAGG